MSSTIQTSAETTTATVGAVKPAELIRALDAVLPHSSTDVALPLLCGIKIETDGGRLIMVATDRYTLGTYSIEWDGPEVDAFLPIADAKELHRFAKGTARHMRELSSLSLTFHADSVEAFDMSRRQTLPLRQGETFVKWRAVMPTYGDDVRGVPFVGLNPAHLTKFAKAAEKNAPLRLAFGDSPVRPVLVTSGAFRGVIMPVRMPDEN